MTLKKIIPPAIMAIAATVANAGAFDGPFVQLGIGGVGTQNKISYKGETATVLNFVGEPTDDATNGTSFAGRFDAGWSQSFDKFNLAGGLFYVIGNQNSGSNPFSMTCTNGSDTATISASQSFKLKNTWGINLEPGYYFTDKTLGYLKFSWFNSTVSANSNVSASYTLNNTSASIAVSSATQNAVSGTGFGFGAKQMFTNNLYGYVDYQYVAYGSVSDNITGASYKPNQNVGMIGLGYKF